MILYCDETSPAPAVHPPQSGA